MAGYGIGRVGGRVLLEEHGRWFHVTPARLDRAERWFARWGNWGVLIGRLTPVIRSFVSYPAGALEMPLTPYTVLTAVGSAIWAFAIAGIGYALGANYRRFDHGFKYAEYLVVAGVVVAAAYLIYRWATVGRRRVSDTAD
jgi:membrane protein DedA with SNARE-associated domain